MENLSILIPTTDPKQTCQFVETVEKAFPYAQVIVAHDRFRKGKGWALREALGQAHGDVIVFLDGDGDIKPSMVKRLLKHIDEFDIVVGKKNTKTFLSRHILTWASRKYIKMMFGIPVDTQTGVKCFRRYALAEWKTNSFAFDIEVLATAASRGFSMYDLGIDAKITAPMQIKNIITALIESVRIKLNLAFKGNY